MIDIIDFSSWAVADSYTTSGRSSKKWLSDKEHIGLFKYPKSLETTEPASEKIAEMLAAKIGLPCSRIDIGILNGDIGSFSYLINNSSENEDLTEGVVFITAPYPDYDVNKLICQNTREPYSIEMVMNTFNYLAEIVMPEENRELAKQQFFPKMKRDFLNILIFDALIGNSDRHHSNWAILTKQGESRMYLRGIAPIYDNGSSLCAYESEEGAKQSRIDNNKMRAIIQTKSKAIIRLDNLSTRRPTHMQVLKYIKDNFSKELGGFEIVDKIMEVLSPEVFRDILSEFPNTLLSDEKKELIAHFLSVRQQLIFDIFYEEG